MDESAYSTGAAIIFAPHTSIAKHSPSEKGTRGRAELSATSASAYAAYNSNVL